MNFLYLFITFGIVFGAIDAIWLKSTNRMYQSELGPLLRKKPNFIAAIIFYMIYVFGVTYFALHPGLVANDLMLIFISALLLGVIAYSTYDLTNLATIKGWSLKIVIIDIIWGGVATSVAAVMTTIIVGSLVA